MIDYGLYKKVYIFNKFVIKIPRRINIIDNIHAILSEQYGYLICGKKVREVLLQIYFIPFVPVLIQKKVNVVNDNDFAKQDEYIKLLFEKKLAKRNKESGFVDFIHPVLTDIKPDNLCEVNGNLLKIDYDFIYYIYNFKIGIKNYFNKNLT